MPLISRFAANAARAYGMFRVSVAQAVDPFFNYVTALLHGDGTNGAQNNTFLDSSTNNFTITRNGNTTQGSFSPFSQTGWNNYFNGSTDYLTAATNAAFAVPAEYTVEFWAYQVASPTNYASYFLVNVSNGLQIGFNTASGGVFGVANNLVGWQLTTTAFPLNQWTHIAITRDASNVTRIFYNGTLQTSGTIATSYTQGELRIGNSGANNGFINGYVSNMRYLKGTALYTANFTPPTTPLTAITNTQLLTAQSNRFIDNSTNAFALTVTGSPSVQAFSPFNPTSAWSASSNGGSGYFDGSGDYLAVANNTAFAFGTGDFTVEFWVWANSSSSNHGLIASDKDNATGTFWACPIISGTLYWQSVNGATNLLSTSYANYYNQWTHVAIVRNGGTGKLYLNGVEKASAAYSTNYTSTVGNIDVGRDLDNGVYLTGYLADVRVVKGTAVYTAAFTPPTAPLTAITNTSLLLNYTNAGIYDNAATNDWETLGNAQITTSVKKYGTGSISMIASGDYLKSNAPATNNVTALGTGDFTIECWVYFNALSPIHYIFDWRPNATNGAYPAVYVDSSGQIFYYANTTTAITGSFLSAGAWYHVAVCRVASQTKMFVNGSQVGATYADTTNYLSAASRPFIGESGNAPGTGYLLNGYIDEFRITKGVGRYPYNFTPPTAAFPNIGGTVTLTADPYYNYTTLLLPGNGTNGAQNNTFLDSSSNAFTITRNGNTTQGTFTPFSQTGWSIYCPATGSYITTPDNAAFTLGSSDFTIECWINTTSTASNYILGQLDSAFTTSTISFYIQAGVSQTVQAYVTSGGTYYGVQTASNLVQSGQWAHIAFVRNGTTLRLYVDGTQQGTASISTLSVQDSTYNFSIGRAGEFATNTWLGYVSNARIIKGTCLYPSGTTFTPSTIPLTAVSGTSLLTCQSNRFVDNSSNALAFTSAGTVSVQAFSPFAPTAAYSASTVGGSGYFDGSGDSLNTTATQIIPATTTYTVEAWIYPTNVSALREIVNQGNTNTQNQFFFYINTTGDLRVLMKTTTLSSGYTVKPNTWTHVAFVSNAGAYTFYVNGVSVASGTGALAPQNTTVYVGTTQGGIEPFLGWISNVRISDTARYTSNFTLPTAPFTSDGNTRLLLSATNGGITDATAKNNLETLGNAQISTTQSKFGGSSMYFDGTGDYLTIPNSNFFDFGAGDFTIEMWVYPTAVGQSSLTLLYCKPNGSGYSGITLGQGVGAYTAVIYASSTGSTWNLASGVSAGTMTANAWNHVAVCRYGTNLYGFVNGVLGSTTSVSITALVSTTTQVSIGSSLGTANTYLTGYIDDLRVTKGIARYTSNFTPPTSAFLLQ